VLLQAPARCAKLAPVVANVVLVLVAALMVWFIVSRIRRHRRGLVAERGTSIGADLAALADQPRARVRSVAQDQPGRVRLVLSPVPDASVPGPDLEILVDLGADEFGFNQLEEWMRSQSVLAMVLPPDSHVLRLRALDDLQPLTLRRVDRGAP
jgi:hypothetical protein